MKGKNLFSLILAAGLVISSQVMAANYVIDKKGQHAFVTFKVSHLGYSYIVGRFNDFEGKFSHDAKKPGDSKVNVVIQARSVDTNHAARDKHLRSEDFLEVSKYPTITFDSTGYDANGSGDKLKGNLTIHGVTREVVIDVRHIGEGKDPWGGYRSGFQGNITIKATDWGMPDLVGELEIELNIEGVRQDS